MRCINIFDKRYIRNKRQFDKFIIFHQKVRYTKQNTHITPNTS